jgi:hypothetical protein
MSVDLLINPAGASQVLLGNTHTYTKPLGRLIVEATR